jgi:hypothetical protein
LLAATLSKLAWAVASRLRRISSDCKLLDASVLVVANEAAKLVTASTASVVVLS